MSLRPGKNAKLAVVGDVLNKVGQGTVVQEPIWTCTEVADKVVWSVFLYAQQPCPLWVRWIHESGAHADVALERPVPGQWTTVQVDLAIKGLGPDNFGFWKVSLHDGKSTYAERRFRISRLHIYKGWGKIEQASRSCFDWTF